MSSGVPAKLAVSAAIEVAIALAAAERKAERGGNLLEVRKTEPRLGAAADDVVRKKIGLRLTDRVVTAVVVDEDFHRQVEVADGLQLLQVELEATVADETDDLPLGRTDGCADSGRKCVSHR